MGIMVLDANQPVMRDRWKEVRLMHSMLVQKVTPKRSEKAITPHNNNNATAVAAFQWKK